MGRREARVKNVSPSLPCLTFHCSNVQTICDWAQDFAQVRVFWKGMLLRDLMKCVRIGDDEQWRTERPSVNVEIRAKLWKGLPKESQEILLVGVLRNLGQDIENDWQMTQYRVIRRHRLRKMSDCICLVEKAAIVGASNIPSHASSFLEIPSF